MTISRQLYVQGAPLRMTDKRRLWVQGAPLNMKISRRLGTGCPTKNDRYETTLWSSLILYLLLSVYNKRLYYWNEHYVKFSSHFINLWDSNNFRNDSCPSIIIIMKDQRRSFSLLSCIIFSNVNNPVYLLFISIV